MSGAAADARPEGRTMIATALRQFRAALSSARWLALGAATALVVAGCVSLTTQPRALLESDDGAVRVEMLACPRAVALAAHAEPRRPTDALDPRAIHVVSWNMHKQADPGWQRDLRMFGSGNDIVLLQEIVLDNALRELIDDEGLRFVMASSFLVSGIDFGVLTAARVQPVATCTERVVEPLLRIPKSAVISWFALKDASETVAVANVHAINFSLSLGAYREQLGAIADALAAHEGPIILAGDLNTWTDARAQAVRDVARRLQLTEVPFATGRRRKFFGHELDHIYTRGLALVSSTATIVTSSDHNPVEATLRVVR
jgi:endonuclease/exonuclease/phosphatase (EEP) superfamily protein YafD